MRIHLIAAGTRMPAWVSAGFEDYAGRLPPECKLVLKEIPLGAARSGGDARKAMLEEGEKMLAAVPAGANVIALDVRGKALSTEELAKQLSQWLQGGRDQALLIGGPDGLAPGCLSHAALSWSLSPLTLPHGLVRVVAAEQLYRAWSILKNHPYHRA
ncbi:MAG TPA: 23S rRNA (pseudouridine(1915)-N(3))-methyltransferase RlmH [Gammaproteobacteria bacterium]|nr:23S rRNA (pseudouridine(1915)-N(3))-methyltransferase RlmH [Gammaproteobacteria bacterium]